MGTEGSQPAGRTGRDPHSGTRVLKTHRWVPTRGQRALNWARSGPHALENAQMGPYSQTGWPHPHTEVSPHVGRAPSTPTKGVPTHEPRHLNRVRRKPHPRARGPQPPTAMSPPKYGGPAKRTDGSLLAGQASSPTLGGVPIYDGPCTPSSHEAVPTGGPHPVNLPRRTTRGPRALNCAPRRALKKRTDASLLGGPTSSPTKGALLPGRVRSTARGGVSTRAVLASTEPRTAHQRLPPPAPAARVARSPRQPSRSQAVAARTMRTEAGPRAEVGGEVEATPGPAGRPPGRSCRRPSARRSAPLPRHNAWKARG